MERLMLEDMIKALKCISSQDAEGDCYADHENFMHMQDDEHKRIICETGKDLRDYISGKEAVGCPYHQNTYGCCFEDGELYWLKDVAELLEELKSYKGLEERLHKIFGEESTFSLADVIDTLETKLSEPDKKHPVNARILTYEEADKWQEYKNLEEQGLLVRLPCKVGDIVYVDSAILPIEDMEGYEDIDNKIPSYFQGRVVSFRFAERNWVKIAVKAKWLCKWIDDETVPESDCIECEKNFSIILSMIGKYIFLTREEAEKELEEMKKNG